MVQQKIIKEEEKIDSFRKDYRFLSNFWPCKIIFSGVQFPSVEHAYQAAKTTNVTKRRNIASLKKPGAAKREGNKLDIREDWEKIKIGIMAFLVEQKFFQTPELGKLLLKTGNRELIEGNHWHDNFWGDCFCQKCTGIEGKNILGRILMSVRKKLQEK